MKRPDFNLLEKPAFSKVNPRRWGQYEQVIQLPGPVKASQMQVERKDHELLITLPKK